MAASVIGIPALTTELPPPASKSIRATISLIWPYSSSTKQCALLLADPDFRLRYHRGQVRVRFTGVSATAVAEGKLGIGDELILELRGAVWATDSSNVSTPGKSVEGELLYRGELGLRVVRKFGQEQEVDQSILVNESTPPPELEEEERRETPARNRRVLGLAGIDLTPIYSSPAFIKRQRLSGGGLFSRKEEPAIDSSTDVDRELEEEERRPKKKQRISDVRDWRVTDRTPSPEKTIPDVPIEAEAERIVEDAGDNLARQIEEALEEQPADRDHRAVFEETTWSQAARESVQQLDASALRSSQTEASDRQSTTESRLFGFAPPNDSSQDMQPPPLPTLQMPEDPFVEPPRHIGSSKADGPSTPKLRPVPGYSLPLPSPFPADAQQFPLGTTRPTEPVPTEHELRQQQQQSLEVSGETTSDDSAVLEINPTIAALARESQQLQSGQPVVTGDAIDVFQSTDSGGFPTALSQAPRERVQHSIDSETVATPDTEVRDDDNDENEIYDFSRRSGVFDHVQSQHPDYLSDTEEDEELEQLYTQAAQREAEQRRLREGIKERDFATERPRAGFAADANGIPVARGRAVEEDVVHEDDAELVIEDMGVEPEESSDADAEDADDESESEAQTRNLSPTISTRNEAAENALETMIDMGTRSIEVPSVIEQSEDEDTEVMSPLEMTATLPAQPALKKAPKTPAPITQKSFGFGFGFDGTSSPLKSVPTPQSQKERTMKKTFGSLFGFRVSPSPEEERQPQQQHSETVRAVSPSRPTEPNVLEDPSPVGAVTRGQPDVGLPKDEVFGKEHQPRQIRDQPPSQDDMLIDEPASHSVQHTKGSEPTTPPAAELHSPLRDTGDHTVHKSQLNAALASSFGPGHESQAEDNARTDAVENLEKDASVDCIPAEQSEDKSEIELMPNRLAEIPETADESNIELEEDERSSEKDLEEHAKPFTASPGELKTSFSTQSPQVKQESRHQDNYFSERPRPMAPPPSSAPVRSVKQETLISAPPSTAPRPSRIEVIDLGSSDTEEDGLPTEPSHKYGTSHDPSITREDDEDVVMDDGSVAGDTEVVSTPEATQPTEPDPGQIGADNGPLSDDVAEPETLSPAAPSVPVDSDHDAWPDAQPDGFFAEQMQAGGPQTLQPSTFSHGQDAAIPASQISNRSIADQYHYFSFQSTSTDYPSSTGGEAHEAASSPLEAAGEPHDNDVAPLNSTTQSEVVAIGSSSPVAAADTQAVSQDEVMSEAEDVAQSTEIEVHSASEQADDEVKETEEDVISRDVDSSKQASFSRDASASGSQRLTRSQAQKLTQSPAPTSDQTQVQVAASSFVDDTPQSLTEQLSTQAKSNAEPITLEESQHRLESQPFETQVPATSLVPPTPIVTNEGLQVGAEEADYNQSDEARPSTPKRTRRRAGSAADTKTPVRRSARKSQGLSKSQVEVDDHLNQVSEEDRAIIPVAASHPPSFATSFDSNLLSPAQQPAVRRSPRKSTAQPEGTTKANEAEESALPPTSSQKKANRKSSGKSRSEPLSEDEMKRVDDFSADDISPPSKSKSNSKAHGMEEAEREESTHTSTADEAQEIKSSSAVTHAARKSLSSRLGQVPEVISAWFSPRRSTRQHAEEKPDQQDTTQQPSDKTGLLQRASSSGLVTTKSYYYPLANIKEKLNASSQSGVDNTVDIIAVVTDAASTPERAKAGPKDFFTIFKVTDQSLTSADDADELGEIRVEVYRHWHATLPIAQAGDVVLLRGFVVKSRKRQPYLLSSDASAWLVWRFSEASGQERSTRKRPSSSSGAREEVKGPPVEFDDGERQRAKELRDWWTERQARGEEEEKEKEK